MTASTMTHSATRVAARHATVRPSGHTSGQPTAGHLAASGYPAADGVPAGRPQLRGPVSGLLDCEDGCHYCQGPETD